MTHRRRRTEQENEEQTLGDILRELRTEIRDHRNEYRGDIDSILRKLSIINMKENFLMSRYSDMLANVTRMSDRVSGLRAVIKALADTPNEEQWKELNDKIIASADEVQAAIDAGAAPAPAPDPAPPAEEPPPATGSSMRGVDE